MDMGFKQPATAAFYREDQEEEGSSNKPLQPLSLLPPPSSSSSTSSSPTRWTADEPLGGSGPPPPSQIEKEHMFDKVVTPSDVGKLNRLVIPKQHAERYFPLDALTNEKGLLLNFEDRDGKPWRFRYSYWNSSQSYVMTKGWSRFVKEKRLDAGDTVSFARGIGDAAKDRLFIDWKRRPEPQIEHRPRLPLPPYSPMMCFGRSNVVQWGHLFAPGAHVPAPPPVSVYEQHRRPGAYAYNASNPYLYLRSASSVGGPSQVGVQFSSTGNMGPSQFLTDAMPVDGHSKASPSKRVRLFGVDLHEPSSVSDVDSPDQVRQRSLPSLRLSIGSPGDTDASDRQP